MGEKEHGLINGETTKNFGELINEPQHIVSAKLQIFSMGDNMKVKLHENLNLHYRFSASM